MALAHHDGITDQLSKRGRIYRARDYLGRVRDARMQAGPRALGGGPHRVCRLSERRGIVEEALRDTYRAIRPDDAVIVGIYGRVDDRVAGNVEMVSGFRATPVRTEHPRV